MITYQLHGSSRLLRGESRHMGLCYALHVYLDSRYCHGRCVDGNSAQVVDKHTTRDRFKQLVPQSSSL